MKIALKTLAIFHGVWLKWERQSSNHGESGNFSGDLKRENLKKLSAGVKPWMLRGMVTNNFKSITALLKNQNIDEDIIKRWEVYGKRRLFQRVVELFDTEKEMSESKIVTVCHGDSWSNNMLFTEDEESVTENNKRRNIKRRRGDDDIEEDESYSGPA